MEAYQGMSVLNSPGWQELDNFLRQHRQEWTKRIPDLESFEHELHRRVLALEREVLVTELARYDVVAEQVRVNGVVCGQALTAPETYLITAGPVRVVRHLYRPATARGTSARWSCKLGS